MDLWFFSPIFIEIVWFFNRCYWVSCILPPFLVTHFLPHTKKRHREWEEELVHDNPQFLTLVNTTWRPATKFIRNKFPVSNLLLIPIHSMNIFFISEHSRYWIDFWYWEILHSLLNLVCCEIQFYSLEHTGLSHHSQNIAWGVCPSSFTFQVDHLRFFCL